MKKLVTLFSLAVICAGAVAGIRIIEAPDFKNSSSVTFRIGSVELSDTSTRVNAEIYGRPGHWIKAGAGITLRGENSGKIYQLNHLEGIPLDTKVFLPDSAYLCATFVFPPLAPSDTIVDFIENEESSGGWNVSGLRLGKQPDGIITHISGILDGRPDVSWLLLSPYCDDVRVNKSLIVPVRNGRFQYTLVSDESELYGLVPGMDFINGSWMTYRFFAEGADVCVEIPSGDRSEIRPPVKGGGPLTRRFCDLLESKNSHVADSHIDEIGDSLYASRSMYSPAFYKIEDILHNEKDLSDARRDSLYKEMMKLNKSGNDLSEAGKRFRLFSERIYREADNIEKEFIRNDTTLVGLYLIYYRMKFNQPDFREFLPVFSTVYRKRFPDHKYSKALSEFVGDEAALPGYSVPDFSAPDLNGKKWRLSEVIKDKVALVDLWASWCGPCRRHSKALIPLYEKWKDKGFIVIGIARENMNTADMESAIRHDGYPWLNLVELNDAGRIWERYGVGNAGGIQVLVDTDGKVVCVDPTPEAIEEYLKINFSKEI